MSAQTKGVDVLGVISRFDIAHHTSLCAYPTADECEATLAAVAELIDLLRISAGNVRSLGPAGALEALPHGPYGEWLRQLDAALARCGSQP